MFKKGTHLSSAHNNVVFVGVWSHCATGSCMGEHIQRPYTENNFREPWKIYNWKTTLISYTGTLLQYGVESILYNTLRLIIMVQIQQSF